ncbi:MAG: redox-sensing transcriptional repressor Rex [Syntrophales bacterium]
MAREKSGKKISLQTVERMSMYRKVLEDLHREGVTNVYSHQLAELVRVSSAQLRRDLASFGSFGNISKGYPVYQMILTISRLFGTDTLQNVALIGVGNLGRALLFYRGFEERGFHIAVVFDIDAEKVGRVFAGRRCHHIEDLEAVLPEFGVTMAILACGAQNLQNLADRLGKAGIRSILNFVPRQIHAAAGMNVENVDFSAKMEKLSFLNRHGAVLEFEI